VGPTLRLGTRMTTIWAESVAAALDDALITLALAVGVCEGGAWEASMWEVPARDPTQPLAGPGGGLVTDPTERLALVQRFSTPWSIAWHALEVLDYDLAAELAPWAGPPVPFADHPHWRDFTSLPRPWQQSELLGYIEHCRQRVRDTFDGLTDEQAAISCEKYRRPGTPYARMASAPMAPVRYQPPGPPFRRLRLSATTPYRRLRPLRVSDRLSAL
jgi:hypothetical protein